MEGFFGEGFPGLNLPPSSTPENGTLGESPPLPQSPLTQAFPPPPPPPVPSNSPPPPVVEPPPSPLPSSAVVPRPPDTSKSETPPSPQIFSFLTPPPPTSSASFPPPDGSSTMPSPLPSSPQVGTPTSKPPSPPSNPSPQVENPPSTSNSSSTVLLPLPIPLSPPLPPSPAEFPSSPIIQSPIIQSPITPVINPSVPGDVPNSLPPPGSPEFSSPTVNPLPTQTKPTDSSSSTSQERPSSNTSPSLTPPKFSNPSPSIPSSEGSSDSSSGIGYAAIVGVALAGVVLVLFAVIIVVVRKKKRKPDRLAVQYKPPSSYSGKSEGYYYKQANITNSVQFSTQSGPPLFPSATGTFGSQRNQSSYSGGPSGDSAIFGNSKSSFTYEEIADMTQGFSQQNLLGEGGFGCVYKGRLTDGKVVAVKQLKAGSGQGEREFRAEVEIISRVHHRHLVSLVGYCISDHHRSLVYEFVPNNTLEHHLHGKALPVMDWPTRLKISIGSARGLAYLHEDCHPRIIHRDIKSANILLDDSFEAQVADFGLAKLSNDTSTHVSTRVMGTFGYLAPEYASSGKLTDRSDVFSFGVVLLELITGRKPVDQSKPFGEESLVEWARPLMNQAFETGNFDELVDPRLENNYAKNEMFRMMEAAAACVRHSAPKRPRMAQVLRALDDDGDQPDLSNGVKYGQSTVFDSKQYSADIQQFRRMAFGSESYSSDYTEEYDSNSTTQSGECSSSRPLNSRRQNSSRVQGKI